MVVRRVIWSFLFLTSLFALSSQTIIPDLSNVSGNWTLSGSPYIIQGRATIPTNLTLTIDPGVEVRFNSSTNIYDPAIWGPDTNVVGSLRVNGKLVANGTLLDTISFVANGPGYWGAIMIPPNAHSLLHSYCKFKNMNKIEGNNSSLGIFESYQGLSYQIAANFLTSHNRFEDNQFTITRNTGYKLTVGFSAFKNNYDSNYWIIPTATYAFGLAHFYNCFFDHSIVGADQVSFANCIFINADSNAIFMFSPSIPQCRIFNSLFYNNYKPITGALNLDIKNTIFINNAKYDTAQGIANWTLDNCVFDVPIPGTWNSSTMNYPNANAGLISPAPINGDFHLGSSSICINTGDTLGTYGLIPNTDLDGNPRYNGTIDIGPYEYFSIGVGELSDNDFTIGPNPCSDFLKVKTQSLEFEFILRDFLGSQIIRQNASGYNLIELKNVPDGIYMCEIISSFGHSIRKIIVEH